MWFSLQSYRTARPSKKLDSQQDRLYPIIEKIGNLYKLQLPNYLKIHPVFSPDKLRKHPNNPLPGQYEKPADPVQIKESTEYKVKKVIAIRLYRQKLQYRVK